MHDAMAMGVVEGDCQPSNQTGRFHWQWLIAIHPLRERRPIDEFANDARLRIDRANFVNRHDIGMTQRSGGFSLTYECVDLRLLEAP
jgi:hypothetical protein